MPIIVISARSEDMDKIDALDAGADDYITKPFSVEELLARIRVSQRRLAITQSGKQPETSVFENGGLKIDYTAGCTFLKDRELHLTPIEYKLLCLLSRNVGKVLTHTGRSTPFRLSLRPDSGATKVGADTRRRLSFWESVC